MTIQQANIESVAQDIRNYFRSNPNMGDTLEGISNWWIASQRLNDANQIVHEALEYLVLHGELNKHIYHGREIYINENPIK